MVQGVDSPVGPMSYKGAYRDPHTTWDIMAKGILSPREDPGCPSALPVLSSATLALYPLHRVSLQLEGQRGALLA